MFTYYPSTRKFKLDIDNVIIVSKMIMSDLSVNLLRHDTDMVHLFPDVRYGFRVKKLRSKPIVPNKLYEDIF